MKDAINLIEHLRTQGVELLLAGDNIRFRGTVDALTPELRDSLKQHRAEIIAHLRQEIVRTGQGGLVVRRGDGDFTQIYRPCRISEMAGNDEARWIITNAFGQKRVPHSFLFHGLSGTGKTTMARIIEMGLNCKQGPTSEPCCECFCCRRIIARKGSMAVIELNSVEKVKDDFRETLKNFDAYGCGAVFDGGRSSILLIDECHGLTKDQAQLFLKYVEDVTEDNYYIFCTTEPDKFLPTLRDRCAINIEFKQVPAWELMNLLINICYLEQLKPNEDVLRRIIEHSEGKPRVAVRELQQRYYAGDLEKITSPETTTTL
jgi:DNA polymerase III subunit gamma/tau